MEFIKWIYFKIGEIWKKSIIYKIIGTIIALGIIFAMGKLSFLIGLLIIFLGFILLIKKYIIKKKSKSNPKYVIILGIILVFIGYFGATYVQVKQDTAEQLRLSREAVGEDKIVGIINTKTYYLPGEANYESDSGAIVYFATEQDAIDSGFHKSKDK